MLIDIVALLPESKYAVISEISNASKMEINDVVNMRINAA
jgi:hypothetical protein